MFQQKTLFEGNRASIQELTIPTNNNQIMTRQVVDMSDSVSVIVIDPENKLILLCQEERYTLPENEWLQYGTIAGGLENGEKPREGGVREAWEEAGFDINPKDLIEIPPMMGSMGMSTEKKYIYLYYADLSNQTSQYHGLEEEQEEILSFAVSFEEFENMLLDCYVIKEPMLVLGYWYYQLYCKK